MAKKLWVENIASFPVAKYQEEQPGEDWIDKTSDILAWGLSFDRINEFAHIKRNFFITEFLPNWSTLTNNEKKVLICQFVYPQGTTETELNNIISKNERDILFLSMIKNINSEMFFKIFYTTPSQNLK